MFAWAVAFGSLMFLGSAVAEEKSSASEYVGGLATYLQPDDVRDADFGQGGHVLWGQPFGDRLAWEVGFFALNVKRESNEDLDDFQYGLGPDLLLSLRDEGFNENLLTPFLLGGLGVFHDDTKRVRDTTGYVNVGAGLMLPLSRDRLRLRLEARLYGVFSDNAPSEADAAVSETDFTEVQISAGFLWGLRPSIIQIVEAGDRDGDGVGDPDDQCPNTEPGAVVDATGCEADSDGDGVFDRKDRCPNTPAGVQVDAAGCPLDADGDGVDDANDLCPNTAPGVPVNAAGCDRDDDRDGVANGYDHCPNTPPGTDVDARGCSMGDSCDEDCDQDGVINRYDHCPGTLPGARVNDRGCVEELQAIVLDGVNFEFDKARLTEYSKGILDRAAETLLGQPGMRVLIEGHTDSWGSDAYNLDLSDRRAASVRQYLIGRGVEPHRLESVGLGETQPIATNETPEGRLKNRRSVFRILETGNAQGGAR